MTISIIVNYLNYMETIKYIEKNNFLSIDKFIIVDNDSPNESYDELIKLESEKIKVIKADKNGGYAYGNNIGIRYAQQYNPDFIILNNVDIEIQSETIDRCIERLQNDSTIGLITPAMVNFKNEVIDTAWKMPNYFTSLVRSYALFSKIFRKRFFYTYKDGVHKVDCVQGSFMIFQNEALSTIIPLLEKQFLYGTEDYIGMSLKKNNYSIVVDYGIDYYHHHDYHLRSIKSELQHFRLIQKDRLVFLKHFYNIGGFKTTIYKVNTFLATIERLIILVILKMFRKKAKGKE